MRNSAYLLLFISLFLGLSSRAISQTTANKIIVVNGGRFEFTPPFTDFVTVGVYDRISNTYTLIDTIDDQSVQDVITYGIGNIYRAYVLTQTHVTSYDLFTGQRLAQVSLLGGARLNFTTNVGLGHILVNRGFGAPSVAPLVQILDKDNLSTVASISGIGDETSSTVVVGTKAYVTVPGNFMSDTGKIAVIDLTNNQLVSLNTLGRSAKGIGSIYYYQNNLYALSSNGYRSGDGKLHKLDLNGSLISTSNLGTSMNGGVGLKGDTLYASINNRGYVSQYNLTTSLADTAFITQSYAAAKYDSINVGIWYTTPDYSSNGQCRFVNARTRQTVASFNVGVSPEAIAVAYYTGTSNLPKATVHDPDMTVYPNPATNKLYVKYNQEGIFNYILINSVGQVVAYGKSSTQNLAVNGVDVSQLPTGQYLLKIGNISKRISIVR